MQDSSYRLIPIVGREGVRAYALVDDADFDRLSRYRWYLNGENGYASRPVREGRYVRLLGMSRDVLGLTYGDGLVGDHINRNRLDNRRANLRVVTHAQNMQNRTLRRDTRSGFRNVHKRSTGGYKVVMSVCGKRYSGGMFRTPEAAGYAASRMRAKLMPFSEDAYSERLLTDAEQLSIF